MFNSAVFERAITHRFELTKLMRQSSENDQRLVHALRKDEEEDEVAR